MVNIDKTIHTNKNSLGSVIIFIRVKDSETKNFENCCSKSITLLKNYSLPIETSLKITPDPEIISKENF